METVSYFTLRDFEYIHGNRRVSDFIISESATEITFTEKVRQQRVFVVGKESYARVKGEVL